MTFTSRDKVATALLGGAVAAYIGYLTFGGVPLVQDVRGMAAVGLVFGFASRRIGGTQGFVHGRAARVGAIACIALGFTALGTENGAVLALFMALTVALWLAAMLRKVDMHLGRVPVPH